MGDPAAAENFVPVVEDGRLAGSDGSLRTVELDEGRAGSLCFDSGGRAGMIMADLDARLDRLAIRQGRDPIGVADRKPAVKKLLVRADDDAVRFGLDPDDIEWRACGKPQAFPLADGEILNSRVRREHSPFR